MMGGSKENRHTPALEHWSIAVQNGKVLENEWRTEIPIPRGGPHRFSFLYCVYFILLVFPAIVLDSSRAGSIICCFLMLCLSKIMKVTLKFYSIPEYAKEIGIIKI